jgi:phosphoadenosine phosphosulfate reductase
MTPTPDVVLALENAARTYEDAHPIDILQWAVARYAPRIVLACSFGGPSGVVALDLTLRIAPETPVYYLDTGLLFPQTYDLVRRIGARYGIAPIAVRPSLTLEEQARRFGPELWKRHPDRCCELRKVEPQREFLAPYDAWISGVRRDQTAQRRNTPVIQWDARFNRAKINPLATWDDSMIWAHINAYDLPYNELHDRGYPSIGCGPCTRAVSANESQRAGRWSNLAKTECGLHA